MDPFITGIDVTESRDYHNTLKKTNNNNIFPSLLTYDCVFHSLINVTERRTVTYYCGTLTCLLCVYLIRLICWLRLLRAVYGHRCSISPTWTFVHDTFFKYTESNQVYILSAASLSLVIFFSYNFFYTNVA